MTAHAHEDAKFAALEQRVYGLERGVQDLNAQFTGRIGEVSAQLSGLAAKLDERSRTPWATIVSACGVVLAIVVAGGQLAKTPLDEAIRRLEQDQARRGAESAPAAVFAQFLQAYEADQAAARAELDAAERRARERLSEAAAALQRQIDGLNGRLERLRP